MTKINKRIKDVKILLVEDEHINRKLFIEMLKNEGLTCDIACNGLEAIQAVEKTKYNIIFMDCQMPVMNGYEASKGIRDLEKIDEHATIIALTANSNSITEEKCLKAGMDDFLTKPIIWDKVMQLISLSLGSNKK